MTPRTAALALGLLLAGCAAGPRPVPERLTAAERLAFAEAVVLSARAVASFEAEASGSHRARFTGTLELTGSPALSLVAEGTYDQDAVKLELESMRGDPNRSVTRGASVSANSGGAAARLDEAVGLGLVRLGLLHTLVALSKDLLPEHAGGGLRDAVQAVEARDAPPDSVDGEACHRVDFAVKVGGTRTADASLCIADGTGLPLQRRATLHVPEGDLLHAERYKWTLKR